MKFKQLQIEGKSDSIKKPFFTTHLFKSLVYIIIGSIAGSAYFYFTEGQYMNEILLPDILKSVFIGGFFGFFITNSPCARNKC